MQLTHMTASVEKITPEIAQQFLGRTTNYRPISISHLDEMRLRLRRGDGVDGAPRIDINTNGCLIGGQHICSAIVAENKPLLCVVTRNAPDRVGEAVNTIMRRRKSEAIALLYPEIRSPKVAAAVLGVCAYCYSPGPIQIDSTDDVRRWMAIFEPGVRWACGLEGERYLLISPMIGALAFAHRTNAEKVSEFAGHYLDHDTGKTSPAGALYNLAIGIRIGIKMPTQVRTSRHSLARKTMNAVLAHIENRRMSKLYDSSIGLDYFRKAHKSKSIDDLVIAYSRNRIRDVERRRSQRKEKGVQS